MNSKHKIYAKIDEKLELVGYIKEFLYDNDILYKISRVGMFNEVFNKKELQEFIKSSNFIVK